MKVYISEQQLRSLIIESPRRKVNLDISDIKKFAEETVGKIQEEMKIQFRSLFTWGAAVGGVMGPLNGFIDRGEFNISPFEKSLILVSVCAMLYNENKKSIRRLISEIDERGLKDVFNVVFTKGEILKNTFIEFVRSLNITLYTMTNIMSYTFLIPILPMLWEISHSGADTGDVKDIVTRLLAFGLTSVSGVTLKRLIAKILDRFK